MTMTHELKVWPVFFAAVADGRKTFEVRRDERLFEVGDTLAMREWAEGTGYTGRSIARRVSFVMEGGAFGLASGYVCLALACPNDCERQRKGRAMVIENLIEANQLAGLVADNVMASSVEAPVTLGRPCSRPPGGVEMSIPDAAKLARYDDLANAVEELHDECMVLRQAIRETLDANGHLADGEVCTLIALKRALKTPNAGGEATGAALCDRSPRP